MKNKGVQQFYAFGRLKAKTMKLKQKKHYRGRNYELGLDSQ